MEDNSEEDHENMITKVTQNSKNIYYCDKLVELYKKYQMTEPTELMKVLQRDDDKTNIRMLKHLMVNSFGGKVLKSSLDIFNGECRVDKNYIDSLYEWECNNPDLYYSMETTRDIWLDWCAEMLPDHPVVHLLQLYGILSMKDGKINTLLIWA